MICTNCQFSNPDQNKFCTGCGSELEKQRNVQTGSVGSYPPPPTAGSNYYPPQNQMLPPNPPFYPQSGQPVVNESRPYSGFWRRVFALAIDSFVLMAVAVILFLPMLIFMPNTTVKAQESEWMVFAILMVLWSLLIGLISILYNVLMESSAVQGTLGKMVMGIKVVDLQGNRISFMRALGRNLSKFLSSAIMNIGYLMVIWTEKKQALHDMIAGTLVLYRNQ